MQVFGEGGQFGPTALWNAGWQIQCRNGQALNFAADALAIVGKADHVEVAREVSSHHGIQTVDILRPILGAPLHANDVTLGGLHGHCLGLGLIALFDRFLFHFGTLDLTARGQALVAQDTQCFHFRPLATAAAVLQDLKITGSGHAIFGNGFFLFRQGAPKHQQFADVLNGRSAQVIGQLVEHGFAGNAVVTQHTNFDQAVGFEGGVCFFDNGRREAIVANHDNGIEVVRFGSVNLALGGSQLNLGHSAIIPA